MDIELISHPDRTLREHLGECNAISEKQLALKFINADRFFSSDLLERMRHLLVYFHDFGKATDYFQLKIIKATEEGTDNNTFKNRQNIVDYITDFNKTQRVETENELQQNERLSNHAQLGSYFVLSNFEHKDLILQFIVLKIIRRHHGNLTNFLDSKEERPQVYLDKSALEFLEKQVNRTNFTLYQNILNEQNLSVDKDFWQKITKNFSRISEIEEIGWQLEDKPDIRYFFLQHFLFSLLLSADKGDMMLHGTKAEKIKPNNLLPLNIIDGYKTWKHGNETKRKIDFQREEAYQLVTDNTRKYAAQGFFSITLPTGLGKTYAAYNAAVILQNAYFDETGKKPRIVYCLPFTSIIDQNEAILREIMAKTEGVNEEWLSKNHYLSTYNDRYETELKNDEPEYLTDGWEHDVIVTTFVQLLESIFTDRNRTLRKFHNMVNAIIVLDEVQNIPPQYFEVVELAFKKMKEFFGTKFIFVTATQPFLFADKKDIQELANPEKYFSDLERIAFDQSLLKQNDEKPLEIADFLEILIADIEAQGEKSFLIICNTIKSSQEIYKQLFMKFTDVLYLSSSILPFKRIEIIDKVKKNKGRQIVVSTQVVEAGVDIDLDIVYRDFAPIDSLNQSAGRCNRNGVKGLGTVKLFNLGKQRYIYDATLLNKTGEILRGYGDIILENQIFELNQKYAAAVRNSVAVNNPESKNLKKWMYELQTENIAKNFKLIEADYRNHNVFIPINDTARAIWKSYLEKCKIENDYERKREIKKIKPHLLQYVTRFPKDCKDNPYKIPNGAEKAFIIYEPNWEHYYDLETGYRLTDDKTFIV